jgi:beta-glucosidase
MVDFTMQFPAGFLWGTATAAHQVEGGNTNNNWHAWEQAGRVYQRQTHGLACDWWNGRYEEDFDRAEALRNNAHRFSIEWSRIEPEEDRFDDRAIAHYADMIAALRARGLEPMVTLHHFTDPLWLSEQGGWLNPETPARFARFVRVVVEALGGDVRLWCTINEPMVYASQGYLLGRFPPGKRSVRAMFRVAEQLLRGHAAAYHAIKAVAPEAEVGFAKHQLSLRTPWPHALHAGALRLVRNTFNRAFVLALTTGELRLPMRRVEVPQARDTLDWIGLNYYYRFQVSFHPFYPHQVFLRQTPPRDGIRGPGDTGEIWPEGLLEQIKWLYKTTGKPLYVTENGVPDPDDAIRPLHMVRSLRSVWKAVMHSYPVRGYFYWTLVDNFEWAEGYDPRFRFGLYACDPVTQERTARPSATLYRDICAANALDSETIRRAIPAHEFDALFPGVEVQPRVTLLPREESQL